MVFRSFVVHTLVWFGSAELTSLVDLFRHFYLGGLEGGGADKTGIFIFFPGAYAYIQWLRVWRLDPGLLALCLGSDVYPLSDLHQVLLSLCASLSTSAMRATFLCWIQPTENIRLVVSLPGLVPLPSNLSKGVSSRICTRWGRGSLFPKKLLTVVPGGGRDIFFCRIATCFCEESFGPLVPVGNLD